MPVLALLCGVLCTRSPGDGWLLLPLLLLVPASVGGGQRVLRLVWIVIPLALLSGAWIGERDREVSRVRAEAVLGGARAAIETHFEGRLLTSPLSLPDGGHRLMVVGQAVSPRSTRRATVRVSFGVHPSPKEANRVLERLGAGDRVELFGRLWRPSPPLDEGLPDARIALASRGVDFRGSVKSARLVRGTPANRRRGIDRARVWVRTRLDGHFSAATGGLLRALLLGDRSALSPATTRALRRSGLMHLVAVSGLHVGLLWFAAQGGLRRFGLHHPASGLLVVLLPLGYGLAVGGRPSVVRAVAAVAIVAAGRSLGRDGKALNTLALLAAGAVVYRPVWVLDPSFQLSFAATAGILLFQRSIAGCIPLPAPVATPLAVSLAAYTATAPIVAWHFGWLAPVGLWANVAAVPLCALILCGGAAGVLCAGTVLIGAGSVWLTEGLALALEGLAVMAARIGPSFGVPRPTLLCILCYYACLLSPRLLPSARGKRWFWAGLALCAAWLHNGPPPPRPDGLEVRVLDVGQAQAVGLIGSDGDLLLVDSAGSRHPGFDPGERIVLPLVRNRGHRRIDTLVLSHDHVDHAGGAGALVRDIEIGEIWIPPGWQRSARFRDLVSQAVGAGTGVVQAEAGIAAQRGGLRVEVLWPGRRMAAGGNEASLVLRVDDGRASVLLPGDIDSAVEARLLDGGGKVEAGALVLAHHGSRTGSSLRFVRHVAPRLAVVSSGRDNRFGHPHAETLRRLRHLRIPLWRTDREGTIRLHGRDGEWTVRSAAVPRGIRVGRRRSATESE